MEDAEPQPDSESIDPILPLPKENEEVGDIKSSAGDLETSAHVNGHEGNQLATPGSIDTCFAIMHEVDIEPLNSLTEDRGGQNEKVGIDHDNATRRSQGQSALISTRRLKRLSEAGPSLSGTDAGEKVPTETIVVQSEQKSIGNVFDESCVATENTNREERRSKYEFAVMSASDEEDEELNRQIDFDLELLSASVAKLRRLAEAMGRGIEMQNRTLARLDTKGDQRAADKPVEG